MVMMMLGYDGNGGGGGGGGGGGMATAAATTHVHDLPDAILINVFAAVRDVRSRNSMSLTCHKWLSLERSTRSSLTLRGNVRDLFLLPTSFSSVTHLDLSFLSPWGHPLFLHPPPPQPPHQQHLDLNLNLNDHDVVDDDDEQQQHHDHNTNQDLIAHRLRQAFPNLTSLTVYARNPSTLAALAPHWPAVRSIALVRWHQRPHHESPGADLHPIFSSCHSLSSLDLSQFYCWPEDIPAALHAYPAAAAALTSVNLLSASLTEGFRSSELLSLSATCPNLRRFLAPCVFNPMHFNFVGDDALLALASNCRLLSQLHLVDPAAAVAPNPDVQAEQDSSSRISCSALERVFAQLPRLEDLTLDLCHRISDAGPALEVLGNRCPKMKMLKLGKFHGICNAAGLHLDGVSICGGLESLCIKSSADLTDSSLVMIARGCSRLSKIEIGGCGGVTEVGIKRMASMLRPTLVDVNISGCQLLDTAAVLRALMPVRDRIKRLHIDCVWVARNPNPKETIVVDNAETVAVAADDDEDDYDHSDLHEFEEGGGENGNGTVPNKRCRYSAEDKDNGSLHGFWHQSWDRLRCLSLWLPAGEVLSPLLDAGLEICPELEEIYIKVEGDCRTCPRPSQPVFGLGCLVLYPKLVKMKLDCGDAIGYALTAPMGQMDLSLWERFYLHGIQSLGLSELDYWPPQDREVNQRSLSLPAAGLIQLCLSLRKLFIHGTAHEHFMRFFLGMPNLRDVQLREDYYPAPENDMSTEMRVDSCSRFEDALNSRPIPD